MIEPVIATPCSLVHRGSSGYERIAIGSRTHAGVEAPRNDIAQSIVNQDVQHHVGIRTVEAAKPRRNDLPGSHAERINAQRPARLPGNRAGLGHRFGHLPKQGGDAAVQLIAGRRWRHAARGAVQQPCVKPGFE